MTGLMIVMAKRKLSDNFLLIKFNVAKYMYEDIYHLNHFLKIDIGFYFIYFLATPYGL